MPSQLSYWNMRGLGEPLRLLLTYAGEDFEDKRYQVGPAPDFDRQVWFNVKHTLGFSLPNLPNYVDGDVKITMANAISRYLAKKYKLDGDTEKEKIECDVALEAVTDLRNGFFGLIYGGTPKDFKQNRDKYVESAKAQMASFTTVLGKKPFLIGQKALLCDIHLCEMLDQHRVLEPTILDDFPKLKEYCARFEALPRIKEYLKSGKRKATPLANPYGNFNDQ